MNNINEFENKFRLYYTGEEFKLIKKYWDSFYRNVIILGITDRRYKPPEIRYEIVKWLNENPDKFMKAFNVEDIEE